MFAPTEIVETGTFFGRTTEFFAGFGVPVFTIEINHEFAVGAAFRLRLPNVTVISGDSAAALERLVARGALGRLLAYLDAHWQERSPLSEELRALASGGFDFVAAIDYFQVSNDPEYGYDLQAGKPVSLATVQLPKTPSLLFRALLGARKPASGVAPSSPGTAQQATRRSWP